MRQPNYDPWHLCVSGHRADDPRHRARVHRGRRVADAQVQTSRSAARGLLRDGPHPARRYARRRADLRRVLRARNRAPHTHTHATSHSTVGRFLQSFNKPDYCTVDIYEYFSRYQNRIKYSI